MLQDKNGQPAPKVDTYQEPPKKQHTIPADVLLSASEDFLERISVEIYAGVIHMNCPYYIFINVCRILVFCFLVGLFCIITAIVRLKS